MAPQNNLICMATYRKKKLESKANNAALNSGNHVKLLIDSLKKMAELYQKQARASH